MIGSFATQNERLIIGIQIIKAINSINMLASLLDLHPVTRPNNWSTLKTWVVLFSKRSAFQGSLPVSFSLWSCLSWFNERSSTETFSSFVEPEGGSNAGHSRSEGVDDISKAILRFLILPCLSESSRNRFLKENRKKILLTVFCETTRNEMKKTSTEMNVPSITTVRFLQEGYPMVPSNLKTLAKFGLEKFD